MKIDSRLKIVAALAVTGVAYGTTGWAADNATASVSANVAAAIAVSKTTDMVVGNFVPTGAGDVTLSTLGVRTANNVTLAQGITSAAAKFTVSGCNNCTYSIDYTGSSASLSAGGGNTMATDWITEAVSNDTATGKTATDTDAASGTLSASGAGQIFAGVKLTVAADQATGAYTGSLKVTTQYN